MKFVVRWYGHGVQLCKHRALSCHAHRLYSWKGLRPCTTTTRNKFGFSSLIYSPLIFNKMENSKKMYAESVNVVENGKMVSKWALSAFEAMNGGKSVLMPHSLVILNRKNGQVTNIKSRCKSSDIHTMAKALVRAYMACQRETLRANNTEAATEAHKRVSNPIGAVLSGHVVYLTNKDGKILPTALEVKGGEPLRTVFSFNKNQPLYKLVIEDGKDWGDPFVVTAMGHYITAAIEQLDFVERCDKAIDKAASANAKEEAAPTTTKEETAKAS